MWLPKQAQQVLPISALYDWLSKSLQLLRRDETLAIGNLFRASYVEALAAFDGVNENPGLQQGIVRARIQPGHAAAHDLNIQFSGFQVTPVQIRNLQLSASGWLQRRGDAHNVFVVEIQPGNCIPRLRNPRLLFQTYRTSLAVELHDSVALRIFNRISKYRGALFEFRSRLKLAGKPLPVKDVISQNQCARLVADKLPADEEGLSQTVGAGLDGIADVDAPVPPVSWGVEMIRMSRKPASISVLSG